MTAQVDVRLARREASAGFRAAFRAVAVPQIAWGLLLETIAIALRWQQFSNIFVTLGLLGLNLLGYYVLEIVVADRFLLWRSGVEPDAGRVGRVLGSRGLLSYCLRRLWTFFMVYVPMVVLYLVVDSLMKRMLGVPLGSSPVHGAQAVLSNGLLATLSLGSQWIACRYLLCTPVFALARGDRHKLFRFAVERAVSIWPLALQISLIASVPNALRVVLEPVVAGWWTPGRELSAGLDLLFIALLEAMYAWFLLLRVGLAVQLVQGETVERVEAQEPVGLIAGRGLEGIL